MTPSAAALWAGIGSEIAAELEVAVFVVLDVVDLDALAALDYRVLLAGQHSFGFGFLVGVHARDAVLVGRAAADSWWHHKLAADAPDLRLWTLRDVESSALALGLGLPRILSLAEIDAKRETWLRIVIEGARRENWVLPAPAATPASAPRTRCRHG